MDEYNRKQELIEKQKQVNEKKYEDERLKKRIGIENRQRKIIQILDKNHQLEDTKVGTLLEKINNQTIRIEKKQMELEKEMMFKNEKHNIMRKKKIKVLDRLSKIQDYQNDINKQKIEEKMRRADEFKDQKQQFLEQKKKMADSISKKKGDVLVRFDKMMKTSGSISVRGVIFNVLG